MDIPQLDASFLGHSRNDADDRADVGKTLARRGFVKNASLMFRAAAQRDHPIVKALDRRGVRQRNSRRISARASLKGRTFHRGSVQRNGSFMGVRSIVWPHFRHPKKSRQIAGTTTANHSSERAKARTQNSYFCDSCKETSTPAPYLFSGLRTRISA